MSADRCAALENSSLYPWSNRARADEERRVPARPDAQPDFGASKASSARHLSSSLAAGLAVSAGCSRTCPPARIAMLALTDVVSVISGCVQRFVQLREKSFHGQVRPPPRLPLPASALSPPLAGRLAHVALRCARRRVREAALRLARRSARTSATCCRAATRRATWRAACCGAPRPRHGST